MVQRLFTKPIWWWERNRKYGVRMRYQALPPLPVVKGPKQYVVLTTPAYLKDALWAAWSWYRYLQPRHFELQLAIDGKLQEPEIAVVRKLFPGISIFDVSPLLAPFCQQRPALELFLRQYPMGRKLGLMLALSERRSFLFSDHDVLAFNFPVELLSLAENEIPCYIPEEREGNSDPALVEICNCLGLDYFTKFNSGLLYVPHNSLSVDLAVRLLAGWHLPPTSWFTEQTVLSVLMREANAQSLSPSQYVVSNRRQFYWEKDVDYGNIAARHFTGTVRHVMYSAGIPEILRQAKQLNNRRASLLSANREGQV
jgi:hypothetical protein